MELEPRIDLKPKPPTSVGHWALILILGASFLGEGLILNEKNHQLKDYETALEGDVKQIGDLIQAHSKCELDLLLYKSIVEEIQKRKEAQAPEAPKKKGVSLNPQLKEEAHGPTL